MENKTNDTLQTTFTYDANGSLTNQYATSSILSPQSSSYSYDVEHRMVGAGISRYENGTNVAITASYVYNQSGIRVRSDSATQVNGGSVVNQTKVFLIDSMNHTGYAQVLEEKDSGGSLELAYTIGDDVLSQHSGSTSHLLYDGHRSTRLLTSSGGSITDRFGYDAYGVQVGTQSSVLSPAATSLLYTGEQFDVDLQH